MSTPSKDSPVEPVMAVVDDTMLSEEPGVSGYWIVGCLAAAGLILLFAALIQHASRLSETLITLTGGEERVVARADPGDSAGTEAEVSDAGVLENESPETAVTQTADTQTALPGTLPSERVPTRAPTDSVGGTASTSSEADTYSTLIERFAVTASEVDAPGNAFGAVTGRESTSSDTAASASASAPVPAPVPVPTATPDSVPAVSVSRASLAADDDSGSLPRGTNQQITNQPDAFASGREEASLTALRRDSLSDMERRSRRVRFEPGSAELTAASEPLLTQIFEDLFLYAESDIIVEVSSADGTDDSTNQALSVDRAQLIRAFLIERGIEPSRLVISVLPDSVQTNRQQYVNIQANL